MSEAPNQDELSCCGLTFLGSAAFALFSDFCTGQLIKKLQNLDQVKRLTTSGQFPIVTTKALKVQAISEFHLELPTAPGGCRMACVDPPCPLGTLG